MLGAFGFGVFKNSPEFVAKSIVSLREVYESHFSDWVMPLMNKSDTNYKVFSMVMDDEK